MLRRAIDEGLAVDVLPGASAVLPAVLMSGLSPQPFAFMGFPPEKSGERLKLFDILKIFPYTLCFYVSPHKAEKQIADMREIFGERDAALVREISKVFQEVIRGNLTEIFSRVNAGVKGELVLIVDGHKNNFEAEKDLWHYEAEEMHANGASIKEIVKVIAEKYSVPKNEIKKFILHVV